MRTEKILAVVVLLISTAAYPFAGGFGTPSDPYKISTREELEAVNNDLSASYVLVNNIDLTGVVYTKAVMAGHDGYSNVFSGTTFTGTFDGAGFRVIGMKISGLNYCGLFGYVGAAGSVQNLSVEGCVISGTFFVGGLVGYNVGSISDCYSSGNISGNNGIGGLVGYNYGGSIANCCSSSNVSATGVLSDHIGGLVGYNYNGSIANCYSSGNVSAAGMVFSIGGLVGYNAGGSITNCYWDIETSGKNSSHSGTGLTTAQMQTQSSFVNWDFENVWIMAGYPALRWQMCEVIFSAGAYGTISTANARQVIERGTSAISPMVAPAKGWRFTGWDIDYTGVTGDLTVNAQYVEITCLDADMSGDNIIDTADLEIFASNWLSTAVGISADIDGSGSVNLPDYAIISDCWLYGVYTVTFDAGENGTITHGNAVQTVASGIAAAAPTITANAGWVFTGWDVAFDNITADLTVTAQYRRQMWTVTFSGGSYGSVSGNKIQSISHGSPADEPSVIPDDCWDFVGWDTDFSCIEQDLTVTALYHIKTYTVTFDAGMNGTVTDGDFIQIVECGGFATAPTITANAGWVFTGWDVAFDYITSDLTVTAQYSIGWNEADTTLPATTWTIDPVTGNLESGVTALMGCTGISSAPTDITNKSSVSFSVETNTGNNCYLVFGITDASGKYKMVGSWSGITPPTNIPPIDLTPYKGGNNMVIFSWSYSKGRHTAGADKVWVRNWQLN